MLRASAAFLIAASLSLRFSACATSRCRTKSIRPGLQDLLRFPELGVIDVVDPGPGGGQAHVLRPVDAEVAVEKLVHLRGDPAPDVDAVGDVADRDLFLGPVRVERVPHLPRNLAMQGADPVGVAVELQGQDRHAVRLLVVARVDPAEAEEVVVRQVERLADLAEVFLDELAREAVVAGGDRRVGGEDGHPGDLPGRLAEGEPFGFHQVAAHLQPGEGAVAFVEVEDRGVDPHRLDRPDAADPEEQLLADPDPGVAAIEPRGQRPVGLGVRVDLRVEQEQRDPPDQDLPDPGVEDAGVGLDRDRHGLPSVPTAGSIGSRSGLLFE